MKYRKVVVDGYILSILLTRSYTGIEISKTEYKKIKTKLELKPETTGLQVAKLRDKDLVWVIFEDEIIVKEI